MAGFLCLFTFPHRKSMPLPGAFLFENPMDYALTIMAISCLLLGGIRRPFLQLVAAEFFVCTVLVACRGLFASDWWFLAFALVNCAFAWAVLGLGHRLSKEYAITLLVSASWAALVFVGYMIDWRAPYDMRFGLMVLICAYQIWLAANDAGAVRGTLSGALHGLFAAGPGGRSSLGAGRPVMDLDDQV